jgi:WD40 repeat protein
MIKHKSIQFPQTPESLVFWNTANDSSTLSLPQLIIGLRGSYNLIYFNLQTFEQKQISMNENDWDTHISFTPLYLSVSPNNKYLLIATDKNMHIVLKIGTNKRVRTLTGHNCSDFGKPIVIWSITGEYLYCNSEEENYLVIYSLAKEKVIDKLPGHHGIIRGLSIHPYLGYVATGSYDKSVIIWDHPVV